MAQQTIRHTLRTLSLLSLSLLVGYALGQLTWTIPYSILPAGPGTATLSTISLGSILEGTSGTASFPNSLTVKVTRDGMATLQLALATPANHFDQLSLTIQNGGANQLSLSLLQPTGQLQVTGPQSINYSLHIDYSIPSNVSDGISTVNGQITVTWSLT